MRALVLAALIGCPAPGDSDAPPVGDQLRGLGVNVGGNNVIHAEPPSTEAGTDLGLVPLAWDDHLPPGRAPTFIVGELQDWTAEIVGDPVFWLEPDFFGSLAAVWCEPLDEASYAADLVVTSASQPGREFRVSFACTGDDRAGILPFQADDLGADGTFAGQDLSGSVVVRGPDGAVRPVGAAGVVPRTGVLDDGAVVFQASDGLRRVAPGGSTSELVPLSGVVAGSSWISSDGRHALYTDAAALHRVDLLAGVDAGVGPTALYTELVWADPDARFALTNSGTAVGTVRDLVLIDSETGDHAPFLAPDGEPWASGWGTGVAALAPDRSRFLELHSYFFDVGLAWVDVATGARTELLDRARHDMEARFRTANHSISDLDVTPDARYAAVVFDDIYVDPGGFWLLGSAVYVIDLEDGTTWLASVDAQGRAMDFALGGFEGRLLEHARIRPDGGQVLFGRAYRTDRSIWLEVP